MINVRKRHCTAGLFVNGFYIHIRKKEMQTNKKEKFVNISRNIPLSIVTEVYKNLKLYNN